MDFSTKTLAAGCFGKVYKQKYGDTWAAMKKVPVDLISKEKLIKECQVYDKAKHNNVVRLLGSPWLEDGRWHIPLEFVFGEDLETAIFNVQKSKIQLCPSVKATIITGMCEGLNFLHCRDIVHQDLKPDNVMVEHGSHRAVIIDLGLAKFFRNGLSSAVNLGNEAYAAPEILQGSVRDKRSDVWAMGKIIAELCARVRLPTRSVTPIKIRDSLNDNPYCSIVCKMVAESLAERTSMYGVIGEIRQIGIIQGANQGTNQGVNHGLNHGLNQGVNHGLNQGVNHGLNQGVNHGLNQGVNHGLNQGVNHGLNQGVNHGLNQGAGGARPYAGLLGQVGPRVTGAADLGAKQKWRPPTPFPPEAKHQEPPVRPPVQPLVQPPLQLPVQPIHRSPFPRAQAVAPVGPANPKPLATDLSMLSIPCPLPPDGTVVHRRYDNGGLMQIKQIITRKGKVVKYEDVKISK